MRKIRQLFWLAGCILVLGQAADAQQTAIAFKGLKAGAGQPVEITADSLAVDEQASTATFTGHVLAVQGDLKLSSDSLLAVYVKGEKSRIDTLTATGNVLMSTPTEAAQGAKAVYSLTGRQIEVTGDVVLTQGTSVMSGNRLVVDLDAGTGHMDGRVKTLLQPGGK
ncbi:MAG: LptA/OstA family protein [Proteobacteria bacterium]|nr:LptA/OstA family protein [Pseudomonadota bacterium]MBS0574031.1 LptA/OstA family protein [Pseudomonadota bacterium]